MSSHLGVIALFILLFSRVLVDTSSYDNFVCVTCFFLVDAGLLWVLVFL